MALILRIKSKSGETASVPVVAGMVLGRAPGVEIQLNDPKLSARHAQIEQIGPNRFILKDLGSTNGIRNRDGKKVTTLELEPGVTFRMGTTEFAIEKAPRQKAETPAAGAEPPPLKKRAERPKDLPKEVPLEAPPPLKWSEYFVKFVTESLSRIKNRPRELLPFPRPLKLSFIRGLQAETVWTLGYGPREVGPSSVDLVIEEENAPPICFTVEPSGDQVIFKTEYPNLVLLNERSVKSDTLKSGDVISIAQTRITVGFAE